MIKLKVQRERLLASSSTSDNITIKTFKDSEVINNRLFSINIKTGSFISGNIKIGNYIYSQKNGKVTARFLIQKIL